MVLSAKSKNVVNLLDVHNLQRLGERYKVEAPIIAKALRDTAFRAALIADPKATLEKELSDLLGKEVRYPKNFELKVVEETETVAYLVLPAPIPNLAEPASELTDAELDPSGGVAYHCTTIGCKPGFSC